MALGSGANSSMLEMRYIVSFRYTVSGNSLHTLFLPLGAVHRLAKGKGRLNSGSLNSVLFPLCIPFYLIDLEKNVQKYNYLCS